MVFRLPNALRTSSAEVGQGARTADKILASHADERRPAVKRDPWLASACLIGARDPLAAERSAYLG